MRHYRVIRPLLVLAAIAALVASMQARAGASTETLVGLWRSQGADARGIAEYVLLPDGRYSVTYQDAWASIRHSGTWQVLDGMLRFEIADWHAAPYGGPAPDGDVFAVQFLDAGHVALSVPGCAGAGQGCRMDLVRVQ
ncbi:MAG: hypothetical protein H6842_07445 [Rhodospirillaceae bacterium]|nr:hypothetical protein [Rhodospirillaceae bacterium]